MKSTTSEAAYRHRIRRSKDDSKDCPPLTDTNIEIEVVRPGRDIDGDSSTHARGSVIKVYCPSGFNLNLPKRKVRCKRGEWRPAMPSCQPISCPLPRLAIGGHFTKENGHTLSPEASIEHGKDVDLVCHSGYFRNGPSRLRCWYGDWSGGASSVFGMPRCVGNPCTLPEITGTPGGKYVGPYDVKLYPQHEEYSKTFYRKRSWIRSWSSHPP
jgi:hypothetical protein